MLFLDNVTGFSCGGAEVLRVLKFVFLLIDLVLLIVPIGLIVMVMIDFTKNVIAGKEDEMKKNANLAIKRIGFAAALFLIPHVISFVVWFLGSLGVDYATCIKIAEEEENLWKYTIDWDYYPYGGEKPIHEEDDYVIWERYTEDENGNRTVIGAVVLYKEEDGKVVVLDSNSNSDPISSVISNFGKSALELFKNTLEKAEEKVEEKAEEINGIDK